jgi:hypothetical protein
LRARVFIERAFDLGSRVKLTTSGFAEGLLGDRERGIGAKTGILRPQELHVEAAWAKADFRVGLSRVVWGRLDEFQPTDVVNPLDVARFFLEGRFEARMPVAMVRGRLLPSERFTLEAIYVPVHRRGRFDQLDEASSPFNLAPPVAAAGERVTGAQGGVRASITSGRVDWAVSAYRGFEPLAVYTSASVPSIAAAPRVNVAVSLPPGTVAQRFPRFTMLGGDFETVRGAWGVRGEAAAFVDRTLQAADLPIGLAGRTLDAGIGVDRRAGAYRVSGTVIVARRWLDAASTPAPATAARIDRGDVNLVAALDRSFARETRHLRVFTVYNPGEESAFARVISTFELRDNVAFEASAGLFTGAGDDALSRLATRDFVYARLKVVF